MAFKLKYKKSVGLKAMAPAPVPPGHLSDIEAAIQFKISPELLEYFTRRSVKSGDNRKLGYIDRDGARFYDPRELAAYDEYLRAPWPKTAGQNRPHLPEAIRKDIMDEAMHACAVCGHTGAGEAAHLVPVAQANSHHPAYLIWLCANHHTGVDKGEPQVAFNLDEAKWLKRRLVERRIRFWTIERATYRGLLSLIRLVASAQAALEEATAKGVYGGVAAIAQIDLDALGKQADKVIAAKPMPGKKPSASARATIALATAVKARIGSVKVSDGAGFAKATGQLVVARSKFLHDTGRVECPVCSGSGFHAWRECIPCEGSGVLDKEDFDKLDTSVYQLLDCPVCEGAGSWKGEDCPACAGDAQLQRWQVDGIETRDFEEVDCPLCDGEGTRNGEDCPACNGDRTMERRFADQVDVSSFGLVDCPLCNGSGTRNHDDCPFCGGDRKIESRHADTFDPNEYGMVKCKLCKGRGRWQHHDPCIGCGGEGEMEQRVYDCIDWSDYDEVECPTCKGRGSRGGEDCRTCGGEGTMMRRDRDRLE